jgi:hypothetical protein
MAASDRRPSVLLLCATLLLFIVACTEEKALALKSAALQYRDRAVQALTLTTSGILKSTAMPGRTVDELAALIGGERDPLSAEKLEFVLTCARDLAQASTAAVEPLIDLRERLAAFAGIFDSLPQASYFAKEEVARAIPVTVRLNQSIVNVAGQIDAGTLRLVDNPRRIQVLEAVNAARAMPAGEKRVQAIRSVTNEMLDLSAQEARMQKEASAALLQAGELGDALVRLARDYERVSLGDVLRGANEALTLAGRISPESRSIKDALTRLQDSTKALENDPALKPLF